MNTPHFKAGYLPGLRDDEVHWQRLAFGAGAARVEVDVPQLNAAQMEALAQRIREASHTHLKTMAVSDIVRVVDAAIARLLDPAHADRQLLERLLPLVSGFDAEMVRLNLSSFLHTFRALQLHRFIAEDFANPKMLDEFQPRPKGGWSKAFGPELLLHVWAGNVPALPLWSFVSGLLVKAGSIGKMASAEPVFATVLARLLAKVEPRWADCFAVVWWQGGDAAQERCAFAQADVVLAYGGNTALQALQAHLPVTTRFLPHGHKLSFGLVSAAALSVRRSQALARLAALDVARYDQQGCYSPHVFYVQRGGPVSPEEFAQQLAGELASLQHKMPRRVLSLEEAAQVGAWREAHEFAAINGGDLRILGSEAQASAVVFSPSPIALTPGPLNRCVLVVALDDLDEVLPLITPQRKFLQTAGLAAAPQELLHLADSLGQAGVTRLCALGAMTAPEAGWHHDGRFSLLDLVRMVDLEEGAERLAERFTTYEV